KHHEQGEHAGKPDPPLKADAGHGQEPQDEESEGEPGNEVSHRRFPPEQSPHDREPDRDGPPGPPNLAAPAREGVCCAARTHSSPPEATCDSPSPRAPSTSTEVTYGVRAARSVAALSV